MNRIWYLTIARGDLHFVFVQISSFSLLNSFGLVKGLLATFFKDTLLS